MKLVGARGHVSELVAQRIVIAKIVKAIIIKSQNPCVKVILLSLGSQYNTASFSNHVLEGCVCCPFLTGTEKVVDMRIMPGARGRSNASPNAGLRSLKPAAFKTRDDQSYKQSATAEDLSQGPSREGPYQKDGAPGESLPPALHSPEAARGPTHTEGPPLQVSFVSSSRARCVAISQAPPLARSQ